MNQSRSNTCIHPNKKFPGIWVEIEIERCFCGIHNNDKRYKHTHWKLYNTIYTWQINDIMDKYIDSSFYVKSLKVICINFSWMRQFWILLLTEFWPLQILAQWKDFESWFQNIRILKVIHRWELIIILYTPFDSVTTHLEILLLFSFFPQTE